jgi:hypothetical protein
MDDLVAAVIREQFSFRIVAAADYSTALQIEGAIKSGALTAGRPRLNPIRRRGLAPPAEDV